MADAICAIATPYGMGAISIIRASGDDVINKVNKLFKGKDLTKVESHTINYGHIVYQGENIIGNRKSVAVNILIGKDGTWTEKEITDLLDKIKYDLAKTIKAELRM